MQKQIIVPFATAIITQIVNASTFYDNLNQTTLGQINASPLELAQVQQANEEQECKKAVADKKVKKERRCQKTNEDNPAGLETCLESLQQWELKQLMKCLPCDGEVLMKHEKKSAQCSQKERAKQQDKCQNKWDTWRDAQLKVCSPNPDLCDSVAKYEREKKIWECIVI